ncbi:PTS sugar transporter subunit IIA [Aeromicrobium piscarium]|uniref:PTS glucose transporter subunit IIA n=1 Tax=Aeromicrobium piscarium TaxID=2590901 RepID=A0A554RJG6_9ACTN|nr:PTS glucose transporter subunit IIA [Aeromicrobium piscarium]TSD54288.1 PTS glucose transporter subunit IIA [Aeromicrobium piscarium]
MNTPAPVELHAPCEGRVVPLREVADPVFSVGTLGPGFAVVPTNGVVVAPVAGTITHVMPSRHGIILAAADGLTLLIHCGIDTVELEGRGLEALVEQGQSVDIGTPLVLMDLQVVADAGYRADVIVVASEIGAFTNLEVVATGPVDAGQSVAVVRP